MNRIPDYFAVMIAIIAATLVVGSPSVRAQSFPSHPLQLVVGYPPGGTGDVIARSLAERLAVALGQPITVENRAGASGAVGARSVAHSKSDGYTLLVGQTPEISISQLLVKDLGYVSERDLKPVALVAVVPLALVVQGSAPYSNVREMIDAARQSNRGLTFASGGTGTPGHIAGELLRLKTQTRLTHVAYEGGGPALDDLMLGRVDFFFVGIPAAVPHVASGQLKMLAVSSAKRSTAAPDVLTIEESGIDGFDITQWVGIFAPRGTPKKTLDRLNEEINRVLLQPELRERLAREGADVVPMSEEQFVRFVKSEDRKYARILEQEFCATFLYGGCVDAVYSRRR